MEEDIKVLIEEISSDYSKGSFMNYIEYMKFPKYKNLTDNSEIKFDFPMTMLVGKNGTGKSSVLQAIYGAPKNKSTGDYWFTTKVDPIEEGKNKYFYGYKRDANSKIKEVLKKRQPSKKAPDYWETAAIDLKIGMKPDDNTDSESRNDPVKKEVVYFDFRGELSAFDKYFHFYKSKPDRKQRKFEQKNKDSKQYIKRQSKYLNRVFNGEKNIVYANHPGNVLHEEMEIIDNNNGRKKLDVINYILGKDYEEIRLVYHRIYESWGTSIMVKTKRGNRYSEANAGSGENAIINMVCAIMDAGKDSLILLDEPEVSLHPSAQRKLKIFLLNMIRKRHYQIVISTHSMVLIEEMPKKALKLFEINDFGTTDITNGVYYKEAFYNIKEEVDRKNLILCEDIAAKSLIEGVLTHLNIREFFSVEYRHGGAETLITKHLPILALDEMYDKVFIILDGDKEPEEVIRYSDIPAGEINKLEKLEDYVKKLSASNCRINPLVDGGEKGSNKEQKIEVYQEYLKYAEKHLFYLPGKLVPEAIVLQFDNAKEIYGDALLEPINNGNAKDSVTNICRVLFPDESCKEATIKMITKAWIDNGKNSAYFDDMLNILNTIYEYCNS